MTETHVINEDRMYADYHLLTRDMNRALGRVTRDFFDAKSVIDFGCGSGDFLRGCLDGGAEIIGYDNAGPESRVHSAPVVLPRIYQNDIGTLWLSGPFVSLAVSVEVAEHLLPECAEAFVSNVVNASHGHIVLTAAPPGQEGYKHINCQPREYWIDLLESLGARYDDAKTVELRELWRPIVEADARYLLTNLMVFEAKR